MAAGKGVRFPQLPTCRQAPERDDPAGARSQCPASRAEGDAVCRVGAAQRTQFPARRDLPKPPGPIVTPRGQRPAVEAEGDGVHHVSVSGECVKHSPGGNLPEPDCAVKASGRQGCTVGTER